MEATRTNKTQGVSNNREERSHNMLGITHICPILKRNIVSSRFIRFYSAPSRNVINNIFNNDSWVIKKPTFRNLPEEEKALKHYNGLSKRFEFNLPKDNKSIYIKDEKFKTQLDKTLTELYHTKIRTNHVNNKTYQFSTITWLKLRDYIYAQLNNSDLDNQIKSYVPKASQYIQPTEPFNLIAQLRNCNSISQKIWTNILGLPEDSKPTIEQKYKNIISKTITHIQEQETIPQTLKTLDTDDTESIDITNPTEWFPGARKMKRHVILHLGPTNSGKTYRALKRLKEADRGYYAGPLRLLAREVYDRFKSEGIACNLLTGEEVISELDSLGNKVGLTAGTVEMLPVGSEFDVVVLDEIQMMADPERGWAWTNALLGARARELHICGEKSSLPLIQKLVKLTGDKLTINDYKRLGKLVVEDHVIGDNLKGLRKGDCVIAFSKKTILDMKLKIEKMTDFKVAVIYGSLPPETRVQQAILFNNGEYDILVASDAIGMGLNLSIDRIIFNTDMKFNGKDMVTLRNSQIKQIGGRAGRFRGNDEGERPTGYITAVNSDVLSTIRKGIEAPISYLESAVIWPSNEIFSQLMIRYPPGTSISFLLKAFESQVKNNQDKIYSLPDLEGKLTTLNLFEHMDDISFNEKLRLSTAPIKDMPMVKQAFKMFCNTIAKRHTRGLLSYNFPFEMLDYQCINNDKFGLEQYEALYNIIMLYFWLANRYQGYFIDTESARDLKYFCELIIFEKLERLKRNPYLRNSSTSRSSAIRSLYARRSPSKRHLGKSSYT